MVKLRKIQISGFRGARFPLPIDFGKSNSSIAIFGENAAGKSSISDAIEWFFNNRVDHLWKEDCKEEALRNVHLPDSKNATVSIDFSNNAFSCSKSLDKALKINETNKTDAFKAYKVKSATERIFLRTTDLARLADESKGDKRKRIAEIIGYEAIIEFREVIQKVENSLQKEDDYIHAKRSQEEAKANLLRISGKLLSTADDLFQEANALAGPFSPKTTISDNQTYAECVADLTQKITNKEAAKKQHKLSALKQSCESIGKSLMAVEASSKQFLVPYTELIADKEKIKYLDLEAFLSKGKDLIDNGQAEPDKCPFCESKVDLGHISLEVAKRIQLLKNLKSAFEKTRQLKGKWVSDLQETIRQLVAFEGFCKDLDVEEAIVALAQSYLHFLMELSKEIEVAFGAYRSIPIDQAEVDQGNKLSDKLQSKASSINDEIKALELTGEEQKILTAIKILEDLKGAFESYRQNSITKESFEKQIKTLAKIKEQFIQIQSKSLQDVLDIMSEDIKRYYLELHPKENIDSVRLMILGTEGVEFEYSFHGKTTYPPRKYLSESHLNSLGLALFLASAKLFNKENRFLVLDDVVTSFDASHRVRLLRLLKNEFHDWQILLLTHQRHWFHIIKKELGSHGWLLQQVDWTEENGVQIKGSPQNIRELINIKQAQGHDVANDVRTLLEEILKDICHGLGVRVSFKFNDRNEERMVGELLSDLRRTLKRKSPALSGDPIFNHIETSNLLGTMGSHDNPKEISEGDIKVALEDIDNFEKLFRCGGTCTQFLSRGSFSEADKKLSCKCGTLTIPWKD